MYVFKQKNNSEKIAVIFYIRCGYEWQGQKDSNPRHAVLETAALPTELYPFIFCLIGLSILKRSTRRRIGWWAIRGSNPGPTGYEPVALTN